MGTVADRAGRTAPALAVVVTLLSVWIILVRPVLPSELHLAGGLVVAGCTVAIGLWAGLDADGLGLSPRRLIDGLRYGGLAFGAVTAVLLLGLAIPLTRHGFHSSRADITAGQLVLQALVTIPVGTVVVEELAFRGALLGLLRQAKPTASAVVACSVLFGLWHVPTVLGAVSGSHRLGAGGRGWHLRGDLCGGLGVLLAADPLRKPAGAGPGSPGDQHGGPDRGLVRRALAQPPAHQRQQRQNRMFFRKLKPTRAVFMAVAPASSRSMMYSVLLGLAVLAAKIRPKSMIPSARVGERVVLQEGEDGSGTQDHVLDVELARSGPGRTSPAAPGRDGRTRPRTGRPRSARTADRSRPAGCPSPPEANPSAAGTPRSGCAGRSRRPAA